MYRSAPHLSYMVQSSVDSFHVMLGRCESRVQYNAVPFLSCDLFNQNGELCLSDGLTLGLHVWKNCRLFVLHRLAHLDAERYHRRTVMKHILFRIPYMTHLIELQESRFAVYIGEDGECSEADGDSCGIGNRK